MKKMLFGYSITCSPAAKRICRSCGISLDSLRVPTVEEVIDRVNIHHKTTGGSPCNFGYRKPGYVIALPGSTQFCIVTDPDDGHIVEFFVDHAHLGMI